MCLRATLDAIVGAIHLVLEAVAFLLGFPFFALLHVLRFLSSSSTPAVRTPGNSLVATVASTARDRNIRPNPRYEVVEQIQARNAPRNRHRRAEFDIIAQRPQRGAGLQFPFISQAQGITDEDRSLHHHHALLGKLEEATTNLADRAAFRIQRMASTVEQRGGTAGNLVGRLRKQPTAIDTCLVQRLPSEIITHILMLAAASPIQRDEISRPFQRGVPTKIARLSRAHYNLVIPRLYGHVHLDDAKKFRLFRTTLAMHNPALGNHVRSLAIASKYFDAEGYLPEQVAEHVTLGVGIEQILLAAPNLQHLFLDLFSLAALHHSTASRLEKGAMPLSLTTEFSLPRYLTLPPFANLQHVELLVFGIDASSAAWLRESLPQLQTLSLRWVSRWHTEADQETSATDFSALEQVRSGQMSHEDWESWHGEDKHSQDLLHFVVALDLLRQWPHSRKDEKKMGKRLSAISVFAWPRALGDLQKHYGKCANVFHLADAESEQRSELMQWNASLDSFVPSEQSGRGNYTSVTASESAAVSALDPSSDRLPPCRLRIGVDESYRRGPRRGPLYNWCRLENVRAWPL